MSNVNVTSVKMSAKLVVHKFESSNNLRCLQITFDNGENDSSIETRYSEWSDGKTLHSKEEREKSSRLVVKIVTGNAFNNFDLDSCAKKLDELKNYFNNTFNRDAPSDYKINLVCNEIHATEEDSTIPSYNDLEQNYHYDGYKNFITKDNTKILTNQFNQHNIASNSTINNIENPMSPLEYSLEKVKENNARIMENIHMLNRTLNYTKKREILDTGCPKSMRYPCNTCGKCFVYETGLKRHYSMRHSMTELQPRWQVVWTCIECFQVWPRQDLALKHSSQCCNSENLECIREIKTSLLLQCEFCEKVYTSIPRLLRHSKIHTTTNNYECNACESTFLSYKAAEQHWLLCPWLKMCYSFALPKMLLCNACDRKFRNYEQLYNHRFKAGHFMTKTHCKKGSVKSLGILVYQCEICGQWFPSISPLKAHRDEHHSHYECDTGMQCKLEYDNTYYETSDNDHDANQLDDLNNQQSNTKIKYIQ